MPQQILRARLNWQAFREMMLPQQFFLICKSLNQLKSSQKLTLTNMRPFFKTNGQNLDQNSLKTIPFGSYILTYIAFSKTPTIEGFPLACDRARYALVCGWMCLHDKSGQGNLADPAVWYQVDYPFIEGWSHFQEERSNSGATALISVGLLKTQTFSVVFFLIFVLIYSQSKQLRWFGKYTRIVYLFGEELELCGNYCNIFRSMNFMSADGQSIWEKTVS